MNTKTTQRKRGRPTGRDRVPLSLEERRARNAQYERERRNEHAQAVTDLIHASGFDSGLSYESLLRHVCCYLRGVSRRATEESVESLRQINTDLLQKIEQTHASLAAPTPPQSPTDEEDTCMRTRPFIYIRKVKKEKISIESTESSNQPIKTNTNVDEESAQITEQPARATVQIKTEVDKMTMPDESHGRLMHKDNTTESRPHKKRKINHNTAVGVQIKVDPAEVDIIPPKTDKRPAKINTELGPPEIEQWPQEAQPQADPLILGLFTEAEAKHDIVQYYIKLLIEEGYDPGASTNRRNHQTKTLQYFEQRLKVDDVIDG